MSRRPAYLRSRREESARLTSVVCACVALAASAVAGFLLLYAESQEHRVIAMHECNRKALASTDSYSTVSWVMESDRAAVSGVCKDSGVRDAMARRAVLPANF